MLRVLADERGGVPPVTERPGRAALRNTGLLLIQRAGLVVAGLGFAAVVPRLLGPDVYGRYALVAALTIVFSACSMLGVNEIVGRHGAILAAEGDRTGLRRLLGSLLALRLGSGLAAAVAFGILTTLWLRELDRVALAAAALAVMVRGIWLALFAFFLGLNQAARWGAGELISRWAVLALVPLGALVGGFRGACIGLLLSEGIVLAAGLWWTRAFLSLRRPDWAYLSPYLRFGLPFFGSNLLSIAFQGSGEALVRGITSDYAQVSYFGVANGAFLTGVAAIQQLSFALVAVLVTLGQEGKSAVVDDAVRRLVSWLTTGGMAVVFAVLLLGPDLVPPVLGAFYTPVATNLIPMALVVLIVSLSSPAGVALLTHDRPDVALVGAAVRLAAFWTFGPLLIARWGSLGACLAVLIASALHAGYLGWRVRAAMPQALRAWITALGLGALFLPLLLVRGSWPVDAALYLMFLGGYGGVLIFARVITLGDIQATWAAVTRAGHPPARSADGTERR